MTASVAVAQTPVSSQWPSTILTIYSTAGGSVTKPYEGSQVYNWGEYPLQLHLLAVPDAGYRFCQWTGDVDRIVNIHSADTAIWIGGDCSWWEWHTTIIASFAPSVSTPTPTPTPTPATGNDTCFIATASAINPDKDINVQTLRKFRDDFLLNNDVGVGFVSTYYTLSPPVADFIEQHPSLKPTIRFGLLPSVVISSSALKIPLSVKIGVLVSIIIITALLLVFTTKVHRKKGCDADFLQILTNYSYKKFIEYWQRDNNKLVCCHHARKRLW